MGSVGCLYRIMWNWLSLMNNVDVHTCLCSNLGYGLFSLLNCPNTFPFYVIHNKVQVYNLSYHVNTFKILLTGTFISSTASSLINYKPPKITSYAWLLIIISVKLAGEESTFTTKVTLKDNNINNYEYM